MLTIISARWCKSSLTGRLNFFSKRKFLGFFVFILAPTERDFLLGSLELIFKVLDDYRIPKGCERRHSQTVVASHKSVVSRMFFNPLKTESYCTCTLIVVLVVACNSGGGVCFLCRIFWLYLKCPLPSSFRWLYFGIFHDSCGSWSWGGGKSCPVCSQAMESLPRGESFLSNLLPNRFSFLV